MPQFDYSGSVCKGSKTHTLRLQNTVLHTFDLRGKKNTQTLHKYLLSPSLAHPVNKLELFISDIYSLIFHQIQEFCLSLFGWGNMKTSFTFKEVLAIETCIKSAHVPSTSIEYLITT